MVTTFLQRIFWLGAVLCASAGALLAADPPRGRPIEFSEPRGERGATNAPSLMPGRTTMFDQLESEINRPFKSMIPGDSLNGMIMTDPRPMPPPVQPSRSREQMNRKRDAMYLTPEEMFSLKPLEDAYKAPELTPDGRNVNSLTGLEREIYRTFNSPPTAATNRANLPGGSSSPSSILGPGYGRNDGSLSPTQGGGRPSFGSMNPLENNLRKALGLERDSTAARAREVRDSKEMFELGDTARIGNKFSPAEARHRDAFMEIYNRNFTPSAGGTVPGGGLYAPDSSFYDPPKPVAAPPAASLPGTYGNPAGASTPYTPSYVPPAAPTVQPTPAPTPVSPFMNVPRRNF